MRLPRPLRLLAALTATGGVALGVMLLGQVAAHAPQVDESVVVRADDASRSQQRPPAPAPTPAVTPSDAAPIDPSELDPKQPDPNQSDPAPESSPPALTAAERADREAGVLDREVPAAGSGELIIVSGDDDAPREAERTVEVRVEVEEGLAIDAEAFGDFVMTTLNDPRGWGHQGDLVFARTDGEADMRVVLASPELTDLMCAPLRTVGEYSCGREGHAVLNAVRWSSATDAFLAETTITDYRHYLVTHEVGHLLGHQHRDCPAAGEVAHVMQQQTISLQGCHPNGWVAP
ncbi:DUF3152 domain-containing protein [Ruania rhizosphaerae]|uniref:DUF3152 domain-containing protein n=1 Tax=Ruania rhizosphaerae TaxID=1840413 RepID=UPI001F421A8A|nr:DUF3152 domain-containing protein [Ruania rhizosphaerae]